MTVVFEASFAVIVRFCPVPAVWVPVPVITSFVAAPEFTVVGSVAVLLPVAPLVSHPAAVHETVALLVTLAGAFPATVTVNAIVG